MENSGTFKVSAYSVMTRSVNKELVPLIPEDDAPVPAPKEAEEEKNRRGSKEAEANRRGSKERHGSKSTSSRLNKTHPGRLSLHATVSLAPHQDAVKEHLQAMESATIGDSNGMLRVNQRDYEAERKQLNSDSKDNRRCSLQRLSQLALNPDCLDGGQFKALFGDERKGSKTSAHPSAADNSRQPSKLRPAAIQPGANGPGELPSPTKGPKRLQPLSLPTSPQAQGKNGRLAEGPDLLVGDYPRIGLKLPANVPRCAALDHRSSPRKARQKDSLRNPLSARQKLPKFVMPPPRPVWPPEVKDSAPTSPSSAKSKRSSRYTVTV